MFNRQAAQTHIDTVAAQYHILIDWASHFHEQSSWPQLRIVTILPATTEMTYASGLHEIGHVVVEDEFVAQHGHARPEFAYLRRLVETGLLVQADFDEIIAIEKAAWAFAQRTAYWWTPAMETVRTGRLHAYELSRAAAPTTVNRAKAVCAIVNGSPAIAAHARQRLEESQANR